MAPTTRAVQRESCPPAPAPGVAPAGDDVGTRPGQDVKHVPRPGSRSRTVGSRPCLLTSACGWLGSGHEHAAPDLGPCWSDASTLSDLLLRLTLSEARALVAELRALARRYRSDDPESPAGAPADARRVVLQFQVLPSASNDRTQID